MVFKNHTYRWIEIREFTGLGDETKKSREFYRTMVEKGQVTGTVIKRYPIFDEFLSGDVR